MNRSSFALFAVVLLAGCETAPETKPTAARPAVKMVSKTPESANGATVIAVETDVGPLVNLNLDADDPDHTIPAKTFPTAELDGFRIALAQDLSMPAVKASALAGSDGIVQITARVCNRSATPRTVDFLCQVGHTDLYYVLPHVSFPAHYARDLRLRINAPSPNDTVWLSVRNVRAGSKVPTTAGQTVNNQTVSLTFEAPSSDQK